jgi:hypothetical protein
MVRLFTVYTGSGVVLIEIPYFSTVRNIRNELERCAEKMKLTVIYIFRDIRLIVPSFGTHWERPSIVWYVRVCITDKSCIILVDEEYPTEVRRYGRMNTNTWTLKT